MIRIISPDVCNAILLDESECLPQSSSAPRGRPTDRERGGAGTVAARSQPRSKRLSYWFEFILELKNKNRFLLLIVIDHLNNIIDHK